MKADKLKRLEKKEYIKKLADNFYFIQAPDQGRFPYCNGFMLSGNEIVLIDSGIGEKLINDIDETIRIDVLIITHTHLDHFLAWHILKDRQLLLPRETPDSITDLKLLGERFTGSAENGTVWAHFAHERFGLQPIREPDGRFQDGELIEVGGSRLEAVYAPGHLIDHYCFFDRDSDTLISTDVDFTGFGPWYGNPESDIDSFKSSIRKLMAFPSKQVCPSHKPPVQGNAASEFESFLQAFDRQKKEILELCGSGKTVDQIVEASPIYQNRMPNKLIQNIFENKMVTNNLSILIREGLIEEVDGKYRKLD